MPESIGQGLVLDMFAFLSRWQRGVQEAVNVVLDTSTAWSLPVALDFSISAADTGIGMSAGNVRAGGCSRHDI